MRFSQIVSETTTSGSIATVESPLGATQSRNASIYGDKKVGSLFKGKKTNKPFANSVSEGKKVDEAKLDEEDIIVIPGQGMKRKTGFIKHGQSRVDHEVEMARSDVLATMKNAKAIYELLKNRTEEEGLEGWVQEKLIKANDYLNAVKEYYDGKMIQKEMTGGVIAGGLQYESEEVEEGAKVDRMVKHIAKSERKLGKSKDEAENIAWATANKRGYLDNKNKKKVKKK
jgi:hypothetical protein